MTCSHFSFCKKVTELKNGASFSNGSGQQDGNNWAAPFPSLLRIDSAAGFPNQCKSTVHCLSLWMRVRTAHTLPETRRRGLRMTFIIASGVFDAWQTDPVIVLCILQLGDLRSTRLGLTHGAVEANPLVSSMGLWAAKLVPTWLPCGVIIVGTSRASI
jgi:hypothetical protein